MNHKWQEHLPFYVAGTLSTAQRNELEDHLKTCPECRARLKEWQLIAKGTRAEISGRGDQPPAFSMLRIQAAKLPAMALKVLPPTPNSPKPMARPKREVLNFSRALSLVALLIAVAFVGVLLMQQTINISVFGSSTESANATPGTALPDQASEATQLAIASLPALTNPSVSAATQLAETSTPTVTQTMTVTPTPEVTITLFPTQTPVPPMSTRRPTNLPPTTMPIVPTRRASPIPPTAVPPTAAVPTNVVVPTAPPHPTSRGGR